MAIQSGNAGLGRYSPCAVPACDMKYVAHDSLSLPDSPWGEEGISF